MLSPIRLAIFTLLVAGFIHSPGYAQPPSKLGVEPYQKGLSLTKQKSHTDYAQALPLFRNASEKGNFNAAYAIHVMYLHGYGVKKNPATSNLWLLKSAKLGSAQAQHYMGNRYQHGIGWKVDHVKSADWFLKAARNGQSHAQLDIAQSYYLGRGVSKDLSKAIYWAEKSSLQNQSFAHYSLGRWLPEQDSSFATAVAAKKSFMSAAKLFKKEASNGNKESAFQLAFMHDKGYGLTEDNSKAYQGYIKLASQGHLWSQYYLAILYIEGKGVEKDQLEAQRWLRAASQGGLKSATRLLARF